MPKIQIEQWQALEIFSRVIAKAEDDNLSDFFDPTFLSIKLKKYENRISCTDLSLKIFKTKKDGKDKVVPKYPQGFYEFGRKIRLSEPIILDDGMLEDLMFFINEGVPKDSSNFYSIEVRNYIFPWFPSKKFFHLQSTIWWLYCYDRSSVDLGNGDVLVEGVTRALLKLNPFGKAELKNYSMGTSKIEDYVGNYSMYGKDEKHISLMLKLKKTNEKDLRILLYVGTDEITFALGQYHNIGRSIYSGTCLLERIQEPISDEKLNVRFFTEAISADKGLIPKYIWSYFKGRNRNYIRTPCTITNIHDFIIWHKKKNP
jgi:hypothetical protein